MTYQPFDVTDRVVVITGGAGLLGEQYALGIAAMGAKVVIADLEFAKAQSIAQKAPGLLAVQLDVAEPESVRSLLDTTLAEFGRVDSLVNNAALDPKFDKSVTVQNNFSFEQFPLSAWRHALEVNLTGSFLATQILAPALVRSGRGTVINISSTYGMNGPDQRLYEASPDEPPSFKPVSYSVTKSAMIGFTKYLAAYYRDKLRINTLTIGGVFNDHDPTFVARYSDRTPLNRMARKDEYVGALAFLISDASSYMTGSNLVCDGGWGAW